ncbi:MAG TPA: MaoC family dehydratase [Alphaproteobacteria bacterium]|nr:MaoC family dehydratase [Alphaproteobacteria bacterium]
MGVTYFEDLRVGDTFRGGSLTVTEADIVGFARDYDPQPMHTDPVAADRGPFAGLIASGWHTTALAMRLFVGAKPIGDQEMLGMGVEDLRWSKPVRPGDTLSLTGEFVELVPSKSNPRRGVAKIRLTLTNQRGEVAMQMTPLTVVPRRPQ